MNKDLIYRSIIMDNYKNPSKMVAHPPSHYIKVKGKVESCTDDFDVFILLEGNLIKDIVFNGSGCSLSTSALNILAEKLTGQTKSQGLEFINKYIAFVKGEIEPFEELGDLIVFKNVNKHLNRVKCALIGANAIKGIVNG